ncbi:MAG: hypothetical protein AAGI23_08330 [Bacteroidota bacterium]
MKKISIVLFAVLFTFGLAQAQDGKKYAKDASKALAAFNLAGGNDADKLKEAIEAADKAVQDAEYGKMSKTWITRGEIYNGVVNLFTTQQFTATEENPAVMIDEEASQKAYNSYMKALELAEKKWETRDALKGLSAVAVNLNNTGITAYQNGDHLAAYNNFIKVLETHKVLKENDKASTLDDEVAYNDQLLNTGNSALFAGKPELAKPLFEELEKTNFDQPRVYSALYEIYKEDDIEKAIEYLNTGREKYPEDTQLLYDEINHYIALDQTEILEDRLQQAIAKEPTNYALYTILSSVYAKIAQSKKEAGDTEGNEAYFDKAIGQLNKAIEVDGGQSTAWYALGELYYNKGANVNKQLIELEEMEFNKENQAKYDKLRKEMINHFDAALPNFIEAEKRNPNDVNTLLALSSIYAVKNELDTATKFKGRIEKINAGESLESYFKGKE